MDCPYCLSELSDEALVCKVCRKDLYLFKPLLAKIADLESKLAAAPSTAVHEQRIRELEARLAATDEEQPAPVRTGLAAMLQDLAMFVLLPLALLILSHWLITVVLDTRLLYLRILSIAVPMPFGLALLLRRRRKVVPWAGGAMVLAAASVVGMSWVTSLVDQTPVLPRNGFEWLEFVEYAASISLAFLTGMLLGSVLQSHRQRGGRAQGGFVQGVLSSLTGNTLTPQQLGELMKKLEEYGRTAVALGTTAMSIYTGLRSVMGN